MIDDPGEVGYRYPFPGERLWHRPWRRWVIVRGLDCVRRIPEDEVPVRFEGSDELAVVKLKSLDDGHQDMLAAWRSLR